jgi:hypothetical protein
VTQCAARGGRGHSRIEVVHDTLGLRHALLPARWQTAHAAVITTSQFRFFAVQILSNFEQEAKMIMLNLSHTGRLSGEVSADTGR